MKFLGEPEIGLRIPRTSLRQGTKKNWTSAGSFTRLEVRPLHGRRCVWDRLTVPSALALTFLTFGPCPMTRTATRLSSSITPSVFASSRLAPARIPLPVQTVAPPPAPPAHSAPEPRAQRKYPPIVALPGSERSLLSCAPRF